MRQLLATSSGAPRAADQATAPRVLVQFWDDASAVPGDVQACLDSWTPLEAAGFERMLFDDTSARRFIEEHFSERHVLAFDRCSHPAMRADYFRLCFMLQVGGLYIDADDENQGADVEPLITGGLLRLQPLVYDIPSDSMVNVARALEAIGEAERIFYVNNNPIVAGPGHPVIAGALERASVVLLAANKTNPDIQSLTGPGNLTASLVAHAACLKANGEVLDFELLTQWDTVAISKWPLAYRADARNWRNWMRGHEKAERL
jgi:mannosyltransferase OCH1-like enzyme